MMPVILDYSISVVWSFLYWISMALFLLTQLYLAATQDWERFWHNWYMVGIFVAHPDGRRPRPADRRVVTTTTAARR